MVKVQYIRSVGAAVVQNQSLKEYIGSLTERTRDPKTPTARGVPGSSPQTQPHSQLWLEGFDRRALLVRRDLPNLRMRSKDNTDFGNCPLAGSSRRPRVGAAATRPSDA